MATREELNVKAKELGINNPEGFNTKAELEEAIAATSVTSVETEEVVAPEVTPVVSKAASEGSEIASAIAKGMENVGKSRPIKITADKSVRSIFAVVRSKTTGDVMLRENSSGVLSKVQLQSLEEQEASMQDEEVEEI